MSSADAPRHLVTSNHRPRPGSGRRAAIALVAAASVYAVVEAGVSFVTSRTAHAVCVLHEGAAPSFRFDAVSGYRVHGGPTRSAVLVRSRNPFSSNVARVGGSVANGQGFPDRTDFTPERHGDGAARFAVLGGAATGGALAQPWPDACEDAVRARGGDAELLNFALAETGLANWHSILTRELARRRYALDGVVIAVSSGDLRRTFHMRDRDGDGRLLAGNVRSWDRTTYPETREEALRWMHTRPAIVASASEFREALCGAWSPPRAMEPVVTHTLMSWLVGAGKEDVGALEPVELAPRGAGARSPAMTADTGRGRLVAEMRDALRRLGVPALVVRVPSLDDARARRRASDDDETRAFATCLDARFVDGVAAFDAVDDSQIRAHWFPLDPTWNQTGSDRFAAWIAAEITMWPVRDGEVRADTSDRRTVARPFPAETPPAPR